MSYLPTEIRERYERENYRNAEEILAISFAKELHDIVTALKLFQISTSDIKKSGGNESEITKRFASLLRPYGWWKTRISADLKVTLIETHEVVRGAKTSRSAESRSFTQEKYFDGHEIDFVKGRVAVDFEWNSKDQTFDRDLYAFRTFFEAGAIDVGVIVTRGRSLIPVFKSLGAGVQKKYGASTTWIGKIDYRLKAGRSGGCPILVFGITQNQLSDWSAQ